MSGDSDLQNVANAILEIVQLEDTTGHDGRAGGGGVMDCEFCNVREAVHVRVPTVFGSKTALCGPCFNEWGRIRALPPRRKVKRAKPKRKPKRARPLPDQICFPFYAETADPDAGSTVPF